MVNKSKLQREVARLKEKKKKALNQRKQLLNRQKEINEIRALEKEVEFLKGVGSKKRIAKEVGTRMAKQAGRFGWKGLKIAGRIAKNVVMAEVKRQEADKRRPAPKPKKRVLNKVKRRAAPKAKPKPRKRVRARGK